MNKNKDKKQIELIPLTSLNSEAGSSTVPGLQCSTETGVCGVSKPASDIGETHEQAKENLA